MTAVLPATSFRIHTWVHVLTNLDHSLYTALNVNLMSVLLTLHIPPKHGSQWPQNSLLMCHKTCLLRLLLVDIQAVLALYFTLINNAGIKEKLGPYFKAFDKMPDLQGGTALCRDGALSLRMQVGVSMGSQLPPRPALLMGWEKYKLS